MKPTSFSDKLKAGWSKADLMRYYALDERHYNKVLACLEGIKDNKQRG